MPHIPARHGGITGGGSITPDQARAALDATREDALALFRVLVSDSRARLMRERILLHLASTVDSPKKGKCHVSMRPAEIKKDVGYSEKQIRKDIESFRDKLQEHGPFLDPSSGLSVRYEINAMELWAAFYRDDKAVSVAVPSHPSLPTEHDARQHVRGFFRGLTDLSVSRSLWQAMTEEYYSLFAPIPSWGVKRVAGIASALIIVVGIVAGGLIFERQHQVIADAISREHAMLLEILSSSSSGLFVSALVVPPEEAPSKSWTIHFRGHNPSGIWPLSVFRDGHLVAELQRPPAIRIGWTLLEPPELITTPPTTYPRSSTITYDMNLIAQDTTVELGRTYSYTFGFRSTLTNAYVVGSHQLTVTVEEAPHDGRVEHYLAPSQLGHQLVDSPPAAPTTPPTR